MDRRRIVVRFNPKLTSVPAAADHAIALVERLSPVPLEFRALDRIGTAIFEAREDFDFVSTLGRIETRLRHALPCGHVQAQPDLVHCGLNSPNDEFATDWPYSKIGAPQAWAVEPGANPSVTIGIIDSGIVLDGEGNVNHPDLDPSRFDLGTNFLDRDSKPFDCSSHGTRVTGIFAAIRNNGKGIPGMTSETRVHVCKTLQDDSHGLESDFNLAIQEIVDRAVEQGRKVVINYSAGGESSSPQLENACEYVRSRDMLLCAAAGKADGIPLYPAALSRTNPNVISVGGIDENDNPYGPQEADILAPAVFVRSTKPPGYGSGDFYGTNVGTSIATPFVTGLAALIWSHNSSLTGSEVRSRILESARLKSGHRIVDAAAALPRA